MGPPSLRLSANESRLRGTRSAPRRSIALESARALRLLPAWKPAMTVDAAQVSLLRWLRRQLAQPTPLREHLEAAVENDDPAEARRLVDRFGFSDEQRRNIEQLLQAWERGSSKL